MPKGGKRLILLPRGFPIFDVQCSGCQFRAQIKTASERPRNVVRGAGWDIYDKVTKAGYLAPPLIVNFRGRGTDPPSMREIRFYPFVPKKNLKNYIANIKSRKRTYRMFNYVRLDRIPYLTWKGDRWEYDPP